MSNTAFMYSAYSAFSTMTPQPRFPSVPLYGSSSNEPLQFVALQFSDVMMTVSISMIANFACTFSYLSTSVPPMNLTSPPALISAFMLDANCVTVLPTGAPSWRMVTSTPFCSNWIRSA